MTGPTDPALRALDVERLTEALNRVGEQGRRRPIPERAMLIAREYAPLAAAEAAPLDVERLLDGVAAVEHAVNRLPSQRRTAYLDDAMTFLLTEADRIGEALAALRSPDTETAGEAG